MEHARVFITTTETYHRLRFQQHHMTYRETQGYFQGITGDVQKKNN